MSLFVDIQCASTEPVPDESAIRGWIDAALNAERPRTSTEISVRLVDIAEMTALNESFRGKQGPTNVLSFPASVPEGVDIPLLGDIIVCVPVVREEAAHQDKTWDSHWAHMMIHGTLHLLGFDHIEDEEAQAMEAKESAIMRKLNYNCPYQIPPQNIDQTDQGSMKS
jgi:probable rRNA maturation factor